MSGARELSERGTDNGAPTEQSRGRSRRSNSLPKFFTIAEVAEMLKVSIRTVRRWIDDELLVVHRPGGIVRIAESDLLAFLAQNRGR